MIKPFKNEKNRYWVNQKPYRIIEQKIVADNGIEYKEDVEELSNYLNDK